ncbi:hypothetical protein [Methylobacterium oryzihabitans]|uniref:Uncharacterized protein n=1 Tax=Methylobacterium oryzihabitans TaxID=2499852 RepID=A0A437PH64_9HYPH|nr:hypothetical protein [Methylobacterium oryzihabitans]RVU21595.1 hypothetical protein EOE48_00615 [Methylobacterium oryzihabitans]
MNRAAPTPYRPAALAPLRPVVPGSPAALHRPVPPLAALARGLAVLAALALPVAAASVADLAHPAPRIVR